MMVLGCALSNEADLQSVCQLLEGSDFYYYEHSKIFCALKRAVEKNKPVDIYLISTDLKEMDQLDKVGGIPYLVTLVQYAGTSAYVEEYCAELKEKSLRRQGIFLVDELRRNLLNPSEKPIEIMEQFIHKTAKFRSGESSKEDLTVGDVLSKNHSSIEEKSLLDQLFSRKAYFKEHGKPFMHGIPTGFTDLDKEAVILRPANLVIVAARPAMGKTAFALNIAAHLCFDQKKPVAFISLEMGREQLAERLLAMKSGISGEELSRGTFKEDKDEILRNAAESIVGAPFFVCDSLFPNISSILTYARRMKNSHGIELLIIDYLQLLEGNHYKGNRQYEVAEISRGLKMLAMELQIPIIAIAQLSRKVEERTDKMPILSDLRDSGQIEQDSDAVVFLYREGYYNPSSNKKEAQVSLKKNRHGSLTSVTLVFEPENGSFHDLTQEEPNEEEPFDGL